MSNYLRIALILVALPLCFRPAFADEAEEKVQAEKARLEKLAEQIKVRANQYRQSGWVMRAKYDDRKAERLLLITAEGPLVIDLVATIDGQPYYVPFEKMRTEMLARRMGMGDGPLKWEEAIKDARFALGRFAYFNANEQLRKQTIKQYDLDEDGLVSDAELRLMLMQVTGGPPLMVMPVAGAVQTAPLMKILDVDNDGTLSEEEIAQVGRRLGALDANDDEWVDLLETSGNNPNGIYGRGAVAPGKNLFVVDEATDWTEIRKALVARYGKDDRLPATLFRASPRLFAALDADGDGNLDAAEVRKLDSVAPFCTVTAGLGKTGEEGTAFTVAMGEGESRPAPAAITDTSGFATLELGGLRLQLGWANQQLNFDFGAQVQGTFTIYDTDKNGYLEKAEVEKVAPGVAQQFAMWDADDDGKVFPAELKEAMVRQQAPQWNRVSLGGVELGSSLWELLDANADGRLSLREVRSATERLKARDADHDGKLTSVELPTTYKLGVARGNYVYQLLSTPGGMRGVGGFGQPVRPAENLDWFARMDRNGDGDLTRREFLGTAEQFKELDKNGDGFITKDEAQATK